MDEMMMVPQGGRETADSRKSPKKKIGWIIILLLVLAAAGWLLWGGESYIDRDSIACVEDYGRIDLYGEEDYADELFQALETAMADNNADAFLETYDKLYFECLLSEDLVYYWDMKSSENVKDDEASTLRIEAYDFYMDIEDRLAGYCHDVLKDDAKYPDLKAALAKHIDNDVEIEHLLTFEGFDEEEMEASTRELELENDFELNWDLSDYNYTYTDSTGYTGEYNLDEVYNWEGDYENLYYDDPDLYYEILGEGYRIYNEKLGQIFLEMVQLRAQTAKSNGYSNYADYADKAVYGRDYDAKTLKGFREAVKEYCKSKGYPSTDDYYYDLCDDYDYTDVDEILDYLAVDIASIDPCLKKATEMLVQDKLYSLGDEGERAVGGYSFYFNLLKEPFIINAFQSGYFDFSDMVHELGHFTNYCVNPYKYVFGSAGNYDLFEIHSQGLEVLAIPAFAKRFPDMANSFNGYVEQNMLVSVADGCLMDEFQREVYAHPNWTLDEINNCFLSLCKAYNKEIDPTTKYQWVDTPHNFNGPMYYISYATSAYAALQIYDLSKTDYQAAVEVWKSITYADCYSNGFMDVCKEAGLSSLGDKKAVLKVLKDI